MIQTRKVQQIPKALEKILESAERKWLCRRGDNPECLVDDFDLHELMRQCVCSDDTRGNCQATCKLYRCHGEYKDKQLKLDLSGNFYIRVIFGEEIILRFQQI